MQFRTQIPINKSDQQINYNSKVVSLGSCFAENISQKFKYFGFDNIANPFGILFHSKALLNFFGAIYRQAPFIEADIFQHNERWHSFNAHSSMSHPDRNMLLNSLNEAVTAAGQQLREATHIFITLGTSWVYELKETSEIVANCHKVPQEKFRKKLLSCAEIHADLTQVVEIAKAINPGVYIVFTVSPVRHIKDGFVENQRSKAHLITAVHQLLEETTSCYFPSYEIMMDDLRDYRFYADDMLHPSQAAIAYIWERFSECFIDPGIFPAMKEIDSIRKADEHRPFDPDSEAHHKFVEKIRLRKQILLESYPGLKF